MDLAKDYQLEERLYVSEVRFLDQNTDLLNHFHLVEAEEEDPRTLVGGPMSGHRP